MDAKQLKNGDFFSVVGAVFKMWETSWEALKLNVGTFIFLALLPLILFMIALPFLVLPAFTGTEAGTTAAVIVALIVSVVLFLVACVFIPAITITQLESVHGRKISVSEAFERSKKYVLRFIGLLILVGLTIGIGLLLLIIPGLLAIFFLSLATYILIDKNTGVIEAMKASYELTKEYWVAVAGLFIVQFVISLLNYLPLIGWIIGLAASIVYFCLGAVVYVKISSKATAAKHAKVVK